ncbi:MAG: ribosome silencing factor [Acidiferrobacterales bacterium]
MRSDRLVDLAQDVVIDAKGEDVRILDVRKITDITDYMVVVTGTSNRHVISIADKVTEKMIERKCKPIGVEGLKIGDWVLVDFGDVVIHVMRSQVREFYSLEKLWSGGESSGAAEV